MLRSDVLANLTEAAKRLFRLIGSGELADVLAGAPRLDRQALLSQRRLSKAEVTAMVAEYRAGGASTYVLAARYRINRQTVTSYLLERGVVIRNGPLSPAELAQVHELRARGLSANRIGARLRRDPKTVRAALRHEKSPTSE